MLEQQSLSLRAAAKAKQESSQAPPREKAYFEAFEGPENVQPTS
jgi:hypothetical protein